MVRRFIVIFILLFLFNFSVASNSHSYDLTHKIGIGLGYPYLSLKYGISPKWSMELRGAFDDGIQVLGGRLYHNFTPEERTVIYCGGEMDCVTFDTKDIAGSGYLGLIFVGGEHFFSKKFTFCLDFSTVYTKLTDSEYSDVSVSGIDLVVNMGINFYF